MDLVTTRGQKCPSLASIAIKQLRPTCTICSIWSTYCLEVVLHVWDTGKTVVQDNHEKLGNSLTKLTCKTPCQTVMLRDREALEVDDKFRKSFALRLKE
ncbi:MAG: hypothetical protein CL912_17640 [Deltaproteobacteria bacterium]|nr:hypothetical protein [Deltaproteobacteria bacterium]